MPVLLTGALLKRTKPKIWSIFLPFAGCPNRCIFCAQETQTGKSITPIKTLLQTTWQEFERFQNSLPNPKPFELAFYGGTFTCLPKADQDACMALVRELRKRGWIYTVRCSTRPDACNEEQLDYLIRHRVSHIELGVQSFNDNALNIAKRDYTGHVAQTACKNVLDANFTLGIQLLPGMPGVDPACFLEDVTQAIQLHPHGFRFYPCLVIKNTLLATLWTEGKYFPWSIETTIDILAKALIQAWRADIPVIRLSLAPETNLEAAILAGPRHPALGSMIMGEALILQAEKCMAEECKRKYNASLEYNASTIDISSGAQLYLTKNAAGFWKGHANNLLPRWEKLGIKTPFWHDDNHAMLKFSQSI